MSDRLYYDDSYLARFSAPVAEIDAERIRIRLGHTGFYPTSGGQPHDLGIIRGIPVVDVIETEAGVEHVLSAPAPFAIGDQVECVIEWERRFDHMQQHTGQHLLSAVIAEVAGLETVSFHMGAESSTIDLACPALELHQAEEFERVANAAITENRAVSISYEDAQLAQGLRKASERQGTLRIVSIDGLDRSACGGTHVRATGEIGAVLIRGMEKVRGNVRLEFICGRRAVRHARTDFNRLSAIAKELGCPLSEAPRVVSTQVQRLAAAEKQRSRLAVDLATLRGRNLAATSPGVIVAQHSTLSDEVRAEAHGFIQAGGQVYLARCIDPPSVLLACHVATGQNAGALLKPMLAEAGGRGGGSAQLAQGSVPSVQALERIVGRLQVVLSSAIVAPPPPSAGDAG
ncbi:MAG TPA: alanyl-tRNA editing protein [Bryobacteraceae bacterium]|nr:alanyl-tRNA editing protein [Bryobacteraceae bacterium]